MRSGDPVVFFVFFVVVFLISFFVFFFFFIFFVVFSLSLFFVFVPSFLFLCVCFFFLVGQPPPSVTIFPVSVVRFWHSVSKSALLTEFPVFPH